MFGLFFLKANTGLKVHAVKKKKRKGKMEKKGLNVDYPAHSDAAVG